MGTRSLTHVQENGVTIFTIYRQFDGYPEKPGIGYELAKFCAARKIINGISGQTKDNAANGAGCFAAQLVAHLKEEIGNVYLHVPDTSDCGEEYTYTINILPEEEEQFLIACPEANIPAPGQSPATLIEEWGS